jgi:chromosome segregation ATPase
MLPPVTAQPDLPRKVSQIRHDLDDLYELTSRVERSQGLIVGVLEQHDNRFEELQQTLNLHGGRLDRIEDSQRRMDGRLDGLDGRLDGLDNRLDGLDGRLDGLNGRLDGLDGRLDGLDGRLDSMQDSQQRLENDQQRQFEHLSGQIAQILAALAGPAAAGPAPESER